MNGVAGRVDGFAVHAFKHRMRQDDAISFSP